MPGTLFGGLATARAASIAGRLQGEEQKRQQTLADRLAAQQTTAADDAHNRSLQQLLDDKTESSDASTAAALARYNQGVRDPEQSAASTIDALAPVRSPVGSSSGYQPPTGTVRPGLVRIAPNVNLDTTQTPAAVAQREKDAELRTTATRLAAGGFAGPGGKALTAEDWMGVLSAPPDVAGNLMKVPAAVPLANQMQARISELTKGGMALDTASAQVRHEFGQQDQVPNYTLATTAGENGQPPQLKPFDTHGGTLGPTLGDANPSGGGAGGAGVLQFARGVGGLAGMRGAMDRMNAYEDKIKAGKVDMGGWDAVGKTWLGSVGTDPTQQGGKGTLAYGILAKQDPELAQYLTDAEMVAEGEQAVQQRPSDFRQKTSQFLSSVRGGAGSTANIDAVRTRRDAVYDAIAGVLKPSGTGARAGGPGPSTGNITLGAGAKVVAPGPADAVLLLRRADWDTAAADARARGLDPATAIGEPRP